MIAPPAAGGTHLDDHRAIVTALERQLSLTRLVLVIATCAALLAVAAFVVAVVA